MVTIVTVYTKPKCVACVATKKQLTKQGVKFLEINIEENPTIANRLKEEGWLQLPVIKTPNSSWSGYNPDKINTLQ